MFKKVLIVFVILAVGNVIAAKHRESSKSKLKHTAAYTHSRKHTHGPTIPTKRHLSRREYATIKNYDYVDYPIKYKIKPSKRVVINPRSSNRRSSKKMNKQTFETIPTTMKPKLSSLPIRRMNDVQNMLAPNKSLGITSSKTPTKDRFFELIHECKGPVSGVCPLISPTKTSVIMQLSNMNSKPEFCFA